MDYIPFPMDRASKKKTTFTIFSAYISPIYVKNV